MGETAAGDAQGGTSALRGDDSARSFLRLTRQGIVDEECVRRCSNQGYAVGQRIVVKKHDVLDFVDLIERLKNVLIQQRRAV
jgi:hypothetical protein